MIVCRAIPHIIESLDSSHIELWMRLNLAGKRIFFGDFGTETDLGEQSSRLRRGLQFGESMAIETVPEILRPAGRHPTANDQCGVATS